MARLKIGTYIIDSADSGSTSTTSGVQLHIAEGNVTVDERSTGVLLTGLDCTVTAATEAALKTAVEAVLNAIERCDGVDLVFEETVGTTLATLRASEWRITGHAETVYGDLTAYIELGFEGERFAPLTNGAGDEPGQLGEITYEYELVVSGLAACIVNARFGTSEDGTIGGLQRAQTYVNKMRNPANYPSWIPATLPLVDVIFPIIDQQPNAASPVPAKNLTPVMVRLFFREMASDLAANAAFASIKVANYTINAVKSPPLDESSGQMEPGMDVLISGLFQFKTEGNTTFDASDTTKTAATALQPLTIAAIAVIRTQAATRMGLTLMQLGGADITMEGDNGQVTWAIHCITAGSRIREWEEEGLLSNTGLLMKTRATNGAEWLYEKNGGPEKSFTHSLTAVALVTPAPYKVPVSGRDWKQLELVINTEIKRNYHVGSQGGDSQSAFVTRARSAWVHVNPGPTKGRTTEYAAIYPPTTVPASGTIS